MKIHWKKIQVWMSAVDMAQVLWDIDYKVKTDFSGLKIDIVEHIDDKWNSVTSWQIDEAKKEKKLKDDQEESDNTWNINLNVNWNLAWLRFDNWKYTWITDADSFISSAWFQDSQLKTMTQNEFKDALTEKLIIEMWEQIDEKTAGSIASSIASQSSLKWKFKS